MLDDILSVNSNGHDIPIRRGYLCDKTGFIKLTLWREYVNLKHQATYIISNVKKTIYCYVAEIQSSNTTFFREEKPLQDYVATEENSLDSVKSTFVAARLVYTAN